MNIYVENPNDIIHETSVDFVLRPCAKEIHIVQYDKSLPVIKVELFRNGKRYALPENASVNIRLTKLDRTFVYTPMLGSNEDRTIVYFEVDEQMATVPGRMIPVVEVITVETNNGNTVTKVACSSPIQFIVERNPIQEGQIESHDSFPIIYELVGQVADHETRISNLESQVGGEVVTLHTNQYNIDGEKMFNNKTSISASGTLELYFTPSESYHAVTKGYIDQVIENIEIRSDVIDVLGTYQDLQNYDTSAIGLNDLIKVISDETHNNAISYYRWVEISNVKQWSYVASEGPFYTISQVDDELNKKVTANVAITGATKCKITYDSKGLVTAGADLDASDIPNLDTAKITSGTFADARIASASAWNAKYDKPSTGIPASDLEESYVISNAAITGATKCKITYDSKGLVTAGADLDASDIPNLDTAKITSGTFADDRIASASAWNAKYDKPSTGIPASDLEESYVTEQDVDKNVISKISLLNDQSQITGGTYPRLLKYNDNKLYLFLNDRYHVSTDKGKTWSDPVILFTRSTETQESGRAIKDVGNAYAFLSPNNDGRIVVIYHSLNRNTPFFSICAKVSDTNGENFGARQELFNSTSGYWEPFYYKGWIYYSSEHDGSGSDKAQSIYRRTIHVDLNGIVSVGSGTRFLDGRNKVDTDGNVNNKTRLDMISAAPIENGHIFVFESSVNIHASTPRPLVVQYCYVEHPENNPAQPTSVVSLFLGSSGKRCGAPFVTTLDDGRIVMSFQTDEKYTGYNRTDFRDNQFVAFVSKRKVNYGDNLTANDFVKLTTYEYGENEYGIWGSVSNIDGILYKTFNIGKNASLSASVSYGNLVQKCLLEYNIPYVVSNAAITGATKCKITYDSKGLVTAGADLLASDIPNLSASKITSGTFADARIASASIWNAKTSVNLNGSDVTSATIYAPTTSGTAGQVLQSNGEGQAPTWVAASAYGVSSVKGGTGLSPTTATSGDVTISIASGYKLLTTSEYSTLDGKYTKPIGGIPASDLAETYAKTSDINHFYMHTCFIRTANEDYGFQFISNTNNAACSISSSSSTSGVCIVISESVDYPILINRINVRDKVYIVSSLSFDGSTLRYRLRPAYGGFRSYNLYSESTDGTCTLVDLGSDPSAVRIFEIIEEYL